ncbi:hypothetical protein BV898_05604 [Hypsibius exemplaris]|uniref:TFIIS N-terminal domain-containing protein n=1 Tax=Hypsibius exemplaris TaxID=2072580 RepID=A0A1W0WYM6_HYPEX|nr:hypothetical protein BV898_05604 [Hypsibius exemplaris]
MPALVALPAESMAERSWPSQESGMVKRVEEYKVRIMSAVDADFNVRDMPTVVQCIEHLERLPLIDTQILLDTRIGKIVNDLRRKLPPEEAKFGKRLKNLAKTWLASVATQDQRSAVSQLSNGEHRPLPRVEELRRESVGGGNSAPHSPAAVNGASAGSPVMRSLLETSSTGRRSQVSSPASIGPPLAARRTSSSSAISAGVNGGSAGSSVSSAGSSSVRSVLAETSLASRRSEASGPSAAAPLSGTKRLPSTPGFASGTNGGSAGGISSPLVRPLSSATSPTSATSPAVRPLDDAASAPATPIVAGKRITIKFGGRLVGNAGLGEIQPPVAKRQKVLDSLPNSPGFLSGMESSLSHDGGGSPALELPLPQRNAATAAAAPMLRVKVKSHEELMAAFQLKNPGLNVSVPSSSSHSGDVSVIPGSSSLSAYAKNRALQRLKSSSSVAADIEHVSEIATKAPTHPPGRGPDPVDAELEEILKHLPPLDPLATVSWEVCQPTSESSATTTGAIDSPTRRHGWTEAYEDQTRTGEKMVILPYIYFPFPPP